MSKRERRSRPLRLGIEIFSKMNILNFACIPLLVFLCGCRTRTVDAPPPKGCGAIVFLVDESLSSAHLDEIENFARSLSGEKPYPEVSFEKGKGISGKTAFRVTRKTSANLIALKSESELWVNRKYPGRVEIKLIR